MIELPWGDQVLRVPVPSGWTVIGRFTPAAQRPRGGPEALCREALA